MFVYSPEEPLSVVSTSRRQCTPLAQLHSQQDDNLMESWDSLTKFNQCQRGRISNMAFEGDIFDEFLQRQGRGPPTLPVNTSTTAPRSPISSLSTQAALCEGLDDDPSMEREDEFEIPVLPQGQRLVINILSTWGDRHYVGLNGLEVFSSSGEPLQPSHIRADPPDINILPAYGKDPRVVTNLIDGANRTQDDMHLWLAPFTPGRSHTIFLDFGTLYQVAMIRVWNYNKSRIHSFRGVKEVEMLLDGRCIFRGEIAKASGTLSGGSRTTQPHKFLFFFLLASSLFTKFSFYVTLLSLQGWTSLVTPSCSPLMMRSWRRCLVMMKPSSVKVRVLRAWSTRRSCRDHAPLMEKERKDPSPRLVSERKTSK